MPGMSEIMAIRSEIQRGEIHGDPWRIQAARPSISDEELYRQTLIVQEIVAGIPEALRKIDEEKLRLQREAKEAIASIEARIRDLKPALSRFKVEVYTSRIFRECGADPEDAVILKYLPTR